jgi:hypothetical protein
MNKPEKINRIVFVGEPMKHSKEDIMIYPLETTTGVVSVWVTPKQEENNSGLKMSQVVNKHISLSFENTIEGVTEYTDANDIIKKHETTGEFPSSFPQRLASAREAEQFERSLGLFNSEIAKANAKATTQRLRISSMKAMKIADIELLRENADILSFF